MDALYFFILGMFKAEIAGFLFKICCLTAWFNASVRTRCVYIILREDNPPFPSARPFFAKSLYMTSMLEACNVRSL